MTLAKSMWAKAATNCAGYVKGGRATHLVLLRDRKSSIHRSSRWNVFRSGVESHEQAGSLTPLRPKPTQLC